jgi:hypothetical protein
VNRLPGINETFELIQRLRSTIRSFVAQAGTLRQEWLAQAAARDKARQSQAQAFAAKLAEGAAAAETRLRAEQERLHTRLQKRLSHIQEAHKRSRKRALELINQREGRQKYTIQKRALEAERQREADLASSDARFEELQARARDSEEQFATAAHSARKAFAGSGFGRLLDPNRTWPQPDNAPDEYQLIEQAGQLRTTVVAAIDRFRKRLLLRLFRFLPLWAWMVFAVAICAGIVFGLPRYGVSSVSQQEGAVALGVWLLFLIIIYLLGRRMARPTASAIAGDLAKARQWHAWVLEKAETRHRQEQEEIKANWEKTNRELDEQWRQGLQEAEQQRTRCPQDLEEKKARALRRAADLERKVLERIEAAHQLALTQLHQAAQIEERAITEARDSKVRELEKASQEASQKLKDEWHRAIEPIWTELQRAQAGAAELFLEWHDPRWAKWSPPPTFAHATQFASLQVDVEKLAEVSLTDSQLLLPGPSQFTLPLLLTYPEQGSLLFETNALGGDEAVAAMNAVLFRLLALAPPGKLSFIIIDPVGLGQNFASLMHLADYEESQVTSRIWTQASQIEEKLTELNEHMEKVIQMYLRNEYATIAEYNAQAGTLAEKYYVLVIAGFPVNFSETAGRRLLNIATSGPRCGVYTLIQWDQRHQLPHDFLADELRKQSVRLTAQKEGFVLPGRSLPGTRVRLEQPPSPQFATEFLHQVGQTTKDTNRVELPFSYVAPRQDERWSLDTAEELRIPLGRSGATKPQYLAIGRGTRQHGLVAGKTGSGKSTLFHVLITNTALWCSPDQVEFYLVDFKKGVEFKCYANRRLPHARVVAIESDREFGLSVLQRVDDELRRRGDLFRSADVQDLASFRKAVPNPPLPRQLLIIDEFQEFFTEEDRTSQAAAVLLDRIVRQGRAFGIHVLLGSQTLGGAYTLARATIGQMVIRIALQCNEADAYLIMDENNAAPRLLSRPGEGLYNDTAGSIEGNSPFQTAWLSDDERDADLAMIRDLADQAGKRTLGPIIFEGNAPALVNENAALQDALAHRPDQVPGTPRVWLGAPNSIKGPTEVVFHGQSGNHLVAIGQGEDALLGIPAMSLISLAAQFPGGALRLVLLESTLPGSREREFLDAVVRTLPHPVLRPNRVDLPGVLAKLAQEAASLSANEHATKPPRTFLIIAGLQDFKQLKQEDEFSLSSTESADVPRPGTSLLNIISDGPNAGFHVIASVDTYTNVTRFLGRKGLAEFQNRVLFQMSAADSASLIDSPDASKLGLYRAILYNDREGYLEKFRPYALSGRDWLEEISRRLRG